MKNFCIHLGRDIESKENGSHFYRCLLVFFPTLAVVVLLTGRCRGSNENEKNSTIATTTVISVTEQLLLSPSPSPSSSSPSPWTASSVATDQHASALSPLPLSANETAGKPSKFDEHVEDWQYVDDPLKNITADGQRVQLQLAPAVGNSSIGLVTCKICVQQAKSTTKTRRDKRNHDIRLLKSAVSKSSSPRHRQYAELMVAAASKQAYRRKRFRRSLAATASAANTVKRDSLDVLSADGNVESSTYKQLFRYKRFRRSVAEQSASEQSYRRKRFRRSAVAAYPNGMIRPYHYHNVHQPYPMSLAADLQQQENRRRRYRYASDPYHYRRNSAASAWDRSTDFRRRYLRFPPTHEAPPPSFNNIIAGNSNPWSPSQPVLSAGIPPPLTPPQLSPQPFSYLPQYPVQQQPPSQSSMGPRSPRLVFRDPIDQGTLQAPYGSNGLQDLLVSSPNDDIKGQCPVVF